MTFLGLIALAVNVWWPPSPSSSEPMPMRIIEVLAPEAGPIWVSSKRALDEEGQIDVAEVGSENRDLIAYYLEEKEGENGCVRGSQTIFCGIADGRERDTLESSARTAELVFVGRVTGMEPGFQTGASGTLFRIEVQEVLKGSVRRPSVYAFLQVGTIPLGARRICMSSAGFPSAPVMGTRLLVMASNWGGCADDEVVYIEGPEDLVIEKSDGRPALAAGFLRAHPELSGAMMTEVIDQVRVSIGLPAVP